MQKAPPISAYCWTTLKIPTAGFLHFSFTFPIYLPLGATCQVISSQVSTNSLQPGLYVTNQSHCSSMDTLISRCLFLPSVPSYGFYCLFCLSSHFCACSCDSHLFIGPWGTCHGVCQLSCHRASFHVLCLIRAALGGLTSVLASLGVAVVIDTLTPWGLLPGLPEGQLPCLPSRWGAPPPALCCMALWFQFLTSSLCQPQPWARSLLSYRAMCSS